MATRTMSTARLALLALGMSVASQACYSRQSPGPLPVAREMAVVPIEREPGAAAQQQDDAAAAKPEPAAPRGNPLWGIPLRALSATRERPLFTASRRPPAPVVAAVAPEPLPLPTPVAVMAPEPERPPLSLSGTIVSPGHSIAIVLNKTTNAVTRVREGEREAGWRVSAVSPRSAVVEKDGRSVTLELPLPGNEPAAATLDAGAPGTPGMPGVQGMPGTLPPVNDGAL